MWWTLRCLLLSTSMLLPAGCALYTDALLGEPATLEPSEWDGLWVSEDAKVVRVKIGAPGIKGIATTEDWRECDVTKAGPWQELSDDPAGEVRRYRDWYFLESCEGR